MSASIPRFGQQPFERADSAVPNSALTTVEKEVYCASSFNNVEFEVQNLGAVQLQDFALQVKLHEDGEWVSLVTGAGWGTATNLLVFTTAALNTLGAGVKAIARVAIGPVHSVRFQARAASSTANVKILGVLFL